MLEGLKSLLVQQQMAAEEAKQRRRQQESSAPKVGDVKAVAAAESKVVEATRKELAKRTPGGSGASKIASQGAAVVSSGSVSSKLANAFGKFFKRPGK